MALPADSTRDAYPLPFAVNVPVVLDGVTITPGDYIYADPAAAVVIPAPDIRLVLEEAVRIEQTDAGYIQTIRNEDPREILRKGSREQ